MDQKTLIASVTTRLEPDQRFRGLFLSGSFGNGTADALSDVDLLAVIPAEHHEAIAADWRNILETIAPVVHFNRLPWALVLNAITDGWQRIDLDVTAPDRLQGRAQDKLKPLIDRDGIYAALPATIPDRGPDPRRIAGTIERVHPRPWAVPRRRRPRRIRARGPRLQHAAPHDVGNPRRRDGQRRHRRHPPPEPRSSTPNAWPSSRASPRPIATRDSVLAANNAVARVFFPRAKALAAKLGIDWPQAFEDATRAVLTRTMPEPTARTGEQLTPARAGSLGEPQAASRAAMTQLRPAPLAS